MSGIKTKKTACNSPPPRPAHGNRRVFRGRFDQAALSRTETPTLRAPPRLLTADMIANERLLIRQPQCGVIFVNDYFATDVNGDVNGDVDVDVLVSPTTSTHPLDGRPRTTRRRANSAQSTINQVLHPSSKRTVGHLSVRAWGGWRVGLRQRRHF